MKHLEVRQKYSAARRIFNSLLGVSSGDETLRLMFDILREMCRTVWKLKLVFLKYRQTGYRSRLEMKIKKKIMVVLKFVLNSKWSF